MRTKRSHNNFCSLSRPKDLEPFWYWIIFHVKSYICICQQCVVYCNLGIPVYSCNRNDLSILLEQVLSCGLVWIPVVECLRLVYINFKIILKGLGLFGWVRCVWFFICLFGCFFFPKIDTKKKVRNYFFFFHF